MKILSDMYQKLTPAKIDVEHGRKTQQIFVRLAPTTKNVSDEFK